MDLNDLFGELDDEAEADELGLFGLRLPKMRTSMRFRGKVPKISMSSIRRLKRRKRRRPSSRYGRIKKLSRGASRKRMVAMKRPTRIKLRRFKLRAPTIKRSLPLPVSQPAAYRHLCANAGMGGSSALQVLTNIQAMVKRAEVRSLATSEHHLINNTQAFRGAVLKRLTAQLRRGKRRRK